MDYSLRKNRKYLESGNKNPPSKEDRNLQFKIIERLRKEYTEAGFAVISIDTKKRELIGNFKNDGSTYQLHPEDVLNHDFPSDATGVAIPYGIYDINRSHGSVYVGYTVDTGEFAVDCIKSWWLEVGQNYYKEPKILILADCGGSNGARLRLWKKSLEKVLCDKLGLHIRVCHYPPGKSKYNPIEHRLFTSTFHKIQESKPKALKAISRRLSEATPPVAEVVSTSRRDGSALPCKFRLLRTFQVRLILANQSPVVASLKPGLIAIKPSVLKSKYNPIEHRLFSEISKNWAGQPLRSYTTMLNYIRTTKTKTGLKVRARMIKKGYRKGIKITDKEFKKLRFKPSEILPKWNYSISPES